MADAMRKKQPLFFKTKAFARLAAKAQILDEELLRAGKDLAEGKGGNLGGNVWKKRLNKNMHRSIVVEKVGDHWFLFTCTQRMIVRTSTRLKRLRSSGWLRCSRP